MDGIDFSRTWEDDRLDASVLAVRPGEQVFVIASAGDLALTLAACGAERVVAVDINPAQLHLAALKRAGAARLDALARYQWFEVGRLARARQVYERDLRAGLSPAAAAFWDRHVDLFDRGFNEHVGVGRSLSRLGWLARILVPSLAAHIETVASPAEQLAFWRARVRGRLFGPVAHWLLAHSPLLKPLAPNPHELRRMRRGHYSYALQERVEGVLGVTLVRDHPWWRPALTGRPADVGHGAMWLDPDRAEAVRDGASRIELVQNDLISALEQQPQGTFDVISVSNVPDWLGRRDARRLRAALVHALRAGGRAVARGVLADERSLAGEGLLRDPISDQLPGRDRTALYGRIDLLWRE